MILLQQQHTEAWHSLQQLKESRRDVISFARLTYKIIVVNLNGTNCTDKFSAQSSKCLQTSPLCIFEVNDSYPTVPLALNEH